MRSTHCQLRIISWIFPLRTRPAPPQAHHHYYQGRSCYYFLLSQSPEPTRKAQNLHHVVGTRSVWSAALQNRIEWMVKRHEELLAAMKSGGANSPQAGKEFSALGTIASLHRQRKELQEEQQSLMELLKEAQASSEPDEDLDQECRMEVEQIQRKIARLENRIMDEALPQDEDDTQSDAIIEIRAGTGGDEASLFSSKILDCYQRTAQTLRWKVEMLHIATTDIGGVREASVSISGPANFPLPRNVSLLDDDDQQKDDMDDDQPSSIHSTTSSTAGVAGCQMDEDEDDEDSTILVGPYGFFKYESGVHRVQRVPVNDSKIHTSACSVAVLPSLNQSANHNNEGLLPLSELKIETMRASGAGGQHVNTTDSAVRITHIPTGIVASIQDERSQHKNKEKAMKLVTARVRDRLRAEEERARGETRSHLMGGGDRSERIRTYNFPQDRVTDHRSKVSRHGIAVLMGGGSVEDGLVLTFMPSLRSLHRQEKLGQLEQQSPPQAKS